MRTKNTMPEEAGLFVCGIIGINIEGQGWDGNVTAISMTVDGYHRRGVYSHYVALPRYVDATALSALMRSPAFGDQVATMCHDWHVDEIIAGNQPFTQENLNAIEVPCPHEKDFV